LAAFFGALYALAVSLPQTHFLAAPLWKLGSGLLMAWIAFGGEARPLRGMLTLLAVSAAFGGALYALSLMSGGAPKLSLRMLAVGFFLFYALLRLISRFRSRWDGQKKARVRLRLADRESSFSALIDSGNSLSDPGTGAGVLVASPLALRPVFSSYSPLVEELTAVDLVEISEKIPILAGRLRLLPYRTLSGEGLLAVFRPDELWIDGMEHPDLLVAISPEARGDGFDAIL
jgi:stage II sporulation protein GA (sporulation sigma-E factor processing peptidase)